MLGNLTRPLLFLFLLAATAAAQSPSKVLKQAEKAFGGAKALRGVTSWRRTGTIKRLSDGATGRYEARASAPNLFRESFDVSGFEFERGHNGRSSWARDSRGGVITLTGDSSLDLQAEAEFRNLLWLDAKKRRARIGSAGTAEVGGRRHNVLVLGTAKGVSIKLYFDAATGLLTREEFALGDRKRTIDYADYRNIGSLQHPHRMSISNGEDRFEIALEKFEANAPIARSEFDFPAAADQPLPDIRGLLAQLQENEEKVEAILDKYSYVQKSTRRELGKDGVLRDAGSETVQLSFYKGYRIRRLIEKDGRPLTEKDQRDADDDAAERVEEIEKIIAKRDRETQKNGPPDENSRRVSVAELLRASNLVNPRRERFRGRDVIVFDFEPNPSFDYKNAKSMLKFFGKTAGVMWIDEEDKQVARLEAFLADSFKVGGGLLAKLSKGASFTLEQERVNDEIWLPSVTNVDLSVRVLLVKGINVNQEIRSYDYRRFETEVKDATVNETKAPEVN